MKPRNSALSQPLWMVAYASKRGYPLNLRHRRGKWHTMVMDQLSSNFHTIPTVQNLRWGSFFPPARTCPRTSLKGAKTL